MSSADCLRRFVNERLTSAAEEIFRVFIQTVVEYEEEIDRQRRLLDAVLKPEVKLQRIELPQQYVCTEGEEFAEQQLCNQERNSSLDQEDPEPPQIKEEQEELCTSQNEEQLVLKQETDNFMLPPAYEDSDRSEPEPESDHQLLSDNSHVAESQNQNVGKHGDSESSRETESEPNERCYKTRSPSTSVYKPNQSEVDCNSNRGKKSFKCDSCGKDLKCKSKLNVHMRTHTGEKPYSCNTCGKHFRIVTDLKVHMRIHTGVKPYFCNTCGKGFSRSRALSVHQRVHTGERPYICKTCGKRYTDPSGLKRHLKVHTELQQQHVHREQEVLTDQQLCDQEWNYSLDQDDPEPPQIKEEQEELCTSQDGEQLVVKLETDTFLLTPEGDQLLLSNNSHVAESQAGKHGDSRSSPAYEESDHQLLCNNTHVTESQDQNEGMHRDFGSTQNAETNPNESHRSIESHINNVSNTNLSEIDLRVNANKGKSSFKCDTCGKAFRFNSNLIVHQRIHTGERPFVCKICGDDFARNDSLQIHMRRAHTGERPYMCNVCGKRYFDGSHLAKHRRSHTDGQAVTSQ